MSIKYQAARKLTAQIHFKCNRHIFRFRMLYESIRIKMCKLPVDCEVDSKNCEDVVDNMEDNEMKLRLVTLAANHEERKLGNEE